MAALIPAAALPRRPIDRDLLWSRNAVGGEVVFNTAMAGYVEALTNPTRK